ncbi:MAG: aldehyde dehydrogenase family protein [Myxococcales bacterium]|nr:aldehyde dehydrogenase family protein [Myxococcales bacterium]
MSADADDRPLLHGREPASGRPLPPVPIAGADEVARVVARARAAQGAWAERPWRERERRLLAFRDHLLARADVIFDVLARESGKPRFEALMHEVFPIVDLAHFFATRAQAALADQPLPLHLLGALKRSVLRFEPRGVIGVIAPWNFPFTIPMGEVLMALAAGNAVVVKPSEHTPRVMLAAKELLDASGLDPDLVGVVPGDGRTGAALLDAGIDMMVFTGSVATGRKVAAACGERLIPCTAELGGKDPAIVLADADVERAARTIAYGAFANCGQICASVERVLVHESLYEALVARVVELARGLRSGDPTIDPHIDLGPMVVPAQRDLVQRHVDEAVAAGARVLCGGAPSPGPGNFYPPTVLVDVTPEMAIWRDETFGPCLPIRRFRGVDQAIAEANASEFGLSAYLFTRDHARAEALAGRLQAGTVMINDVLYTHALPEAPWGGVKRSGIGRVHGLQALRDLCEVKHIASPRVELRQPWLFPYSERRFRLMRRAIERTFGSLFARLL